MSSLYFYEVWVSSSRYHGDKPLTYHSETSLSAGQVVIVPLRRQTVLGFIKTEVDKPAFKTQPITKQISEISLPKSLLQLFDWLISYYPGPSGVLAQLFLPSGLLKSPKKTPLETTAKNKPKLLPRLTGDQTNTLADLSKLPRDTAVLLHGDTGTGKTRIYVELAREQLEAGKSVLVLTPEIGLTPQLAQTFEDSFPGQVISSHSHLTSAERRDIWISILESSTPLIIIGPRSALFSPIANLGLVVMDEAHDAAYKQEQMPYYQTSRVAARLAKLSKSRLILGTATPLVTDYFTFQAKKLPIIRMTEPATKGAITKLKTMTIPLQDKSRFSRSQWISDTLVAQLSEALQRGHQALLFLNRRGTARVVLCQQCGWQLLCPNCDLPLTYHADDHQARCHTCGFRTLPPAECPSCASTEIVFKSIGTKLIVSEIKKLLPEARVRRFDSDNLKAERLEQHYNSVKTGDLDILVGTQLLTKGLDLPKLALVGVIIADTGLYIPDYTAEEKTFQMLSQVIGRVGRGHIPGTVVVQSYHPDNAAITAALNKDYESFYEQETKQREAFGFPPFYYLLKLSCARASRSSAESASKKLYQDIVSMFSGIEIIGPSPAFYERQAGKYSWQIIVKSRRRDVLTSIINTLPANCSYDIDPNNLL